MLSSAPSAQCPTYLGTSRLNWTVNRVTGFSKSGTLFYMGLAHQT